MRNAQERGLVIFPFPLSAVFYFKDCVHVQGGLNRKIDAVKICGLTNGSKKVYNLLQSKDPEMQKPIDYSHRKIR